MSDKEGTIPDLIKSSLDGDGYEREIIDLRKLSKDRLISEIMCLRIALKIEEALLNFSKARISRLMDKEK